MVDMLDKIWDGIKDNVLQKTTNPFFGTLIAIWLVHNWQFIYTIFNFEFA